MKKNYLIYLLPAVFILTSGMYWPSRWDEDYDTEVRSGYHLVTGLYPTHESGWYRKQAEEEAKAFDRILFYMHTGNPKQTLEMIEKATDITPESRSKLKAEVYFIKGDYRMADSLLRMSGDTGAVSLGHELFLSLAAYLAKNADGSFPVGSPDRLGFFEFIQEKGDLLSRFETDEALANEIFHWWYWYGTENPALLEAGADLLAGLQEPEANVLAAFSYLKAGQLVQQQAARKAYEQMAKNTLSLTDVSGMQGILKDDLAAAKQQEMAPLTSPAEIKPYFADSNMKASAFAKEMAYKMGVKEKQNPNLEIGNKEIDQKKIKSNPIHNFYAIGILAVLIGAVIFFWYRIRKESQKRENQE